MGLLINVYRSAGQPDCTKGGISSQYTHLCVVNAEGPSEPLANAPAVILDNHLQSSLRLVPAEKVDGEWMIAGGQWMMGGNYGATVNSRFGEAIERLSGNRFYGAVAIHDRCECGACNRHEKGTSNTSRIKTELPGWLTSSNNKSNLQRVHVVTGRHPYIDGCPVLTFNSSQSANEYAANLTNIIRRDSGLIDIREATPEDWTLVMDLISEQLTETLGQGCWVSVDERDILP